MSHFFTTSAVIALMGPVAYRTKKYGFCYMAMFYIIGLVAVPVSFFFCGGKDCGVPMYCSTLILIGAVAPVSFKRRCVGFVIVFAWMGCAMVLSMLGLPDVRDMQLRVDGASASVNFVGCYVLMAFIVFFIGSFVISAYGKERESREVLLEKLDFISTHDYLTKLYNRRYLTDCLDNMAWQQQKDFYIVVFDIDDFKTTNCTYGRMFGGRVLVDVANVLKEAADEKLGECAARYGGEQFIYVICAANEIDAYAKADRVREKVDSLVWNDRPMAHVTVSGGFSACRNRNAVDYRLALRRVDEMLFLAKSKGKNQIRNLTE